MNMNEYEYEYHHLADSADYIDETNDDYYYDSGNDEPWMVESEDEGQENTTEFQNYYEDIDELDD